MADFGDGFTRIDPHDDRNWNPVFIECGSSSIGIFGSYGDGEPSTKMMIHMEPQQLLNLANVLRAYLEQQNAETLKIVEGGKK